MLDSTTRNYLASFIPEALAGTKSLLPTSTDSIFREKFGRCGHGRASCPLANSYPVYFT